MRGSGKLTLIVLVLLTVAPAPLAQPRSIPLRIEDALGGLTFPQWTPISVSADGELVAYTLQDAKRLDPARDSRYRWFTPTGVPNAWTATDVWVTNVKTGESKNLTQSKGSAWDPVWSPDGNNLAFYSDEGGAAHLWLWDRLKDRLYQMSQVIVRPYFGFEAPVWAPDGKRILVKTLPEGMTLEQATDFLTGPKLEKEKVKETDVTVRIYSSIIPDKSVSPASADDTPAFVKAETADLAMINVSTGTAERIARGYRPEAYWISPDGSQVAFSAYKIVKQQNRPGAVYDLVVVALAKGPPRTVASNVHMDYGLAASWSPNGKLLAYTDSKPGTSASGEDLPGDCFVVSVAGGEPHPLTRKQHPSFSRELRAPIWDAKSEYLYFLAGNAVWKVSVAAGTTTELGKNSGRTLREIVSAHVGGSFWSPDGGHSMIVQTRDSQTRNVGFYRVDSETGSLTKVLEESKSYGAEFSIDVSGNGKRVVYIAQDAQQSPDVWAADESFSNPRRLTHINPAFDNYVFGRSRLIEYRDADGRPLRGALLLPSDYHEGKAYPMVVVVYGGSNGSNALNSFGLYGRGVENCQLLATRGYAVLWPDTPLRSGSPVGDLAKTVLPAIDKAIELGIADPNRIGVMGHSHGGYSTLALIVQSTRFKAAVSSAGFGDLIGQYGKMRTDGSAVGVDWSEQGPGLMGGSPWQFRDRYLENSPVFFLDRVETPLLIIQGELDQTVPPFLSDEVFVGLRRLGKEVVYARYAKEDHEPNGWSYADQVDYVNRIIAWFDEHLKKPEN